MLMVVGGDRYNDTITVTLILQIKCNNCAPTPDWRWCRLFVKLGILPG